MKKFLQLAVAFAATVALSAPICAADAPFDGEKYETVNLEAVPDGVSNYENYSNRWTINRSCKEFATLVRNGHILKQVPASNVRDVYTFEEFSKTESGSLHVTFYSNQATTPAKYTGYYTVIIPAGFLFAPDGTPNDEIRANYYVNNSEFIAEPATGSTVETLSKITLTFPDALTLSYSGTPCDYEFVPYGSALGDDETAPDNSKISPSIEGNVATFTFPQPITTPGRMMLTLNTGTFTTTYAEGPESSRNFFGGITIVVSGTNTDQQDWTVTPAEGTYTGFASSEVEGTQTATAGGYQAYFIVNVPEGRTTKTLLMSPIKFMNDASSTTLNKQMLPDKSGICLYSSTYKLWREKNTFVPAPGDYELVIPKDLITLDDDTKNPELRFKYTIIDASEGDDTRYTVSPDPYAVVESPLAEIVIDFPEAEKVVWTPGHYANIACGDIEYVGTGKVSDETPNKLIITIPGDLNLDGVYNVTVPSAALTVDGRSCPLSFTYTLELKTNSVEEVAASADSFDVYTLDGVNVASGVNADTLKALAPAIYVVNGKKVIVK